MEYRDGNTALIGDTIELDGGHTGKVVCVIADSQFSEQYPKEKWAYLKHGILVDTTFGGLVHYDDNDYLIKLISREKTA